MTTPQSQVHFGAKEFVRVPGSIYVPIWVARNKFYSISATALNGAGIRVVEIDEPGSNQDYKLLSVYGPEGKVYQAIPRLRVFFENKTAGGTVEMKVLGKTATGETQIELATTGALAGVGHKTLEYDIFTKYINLQLVVSVANSTINGQAGLLYGPD